MLFRESFLDGLQADLSQPFPWTSAFSFCLRILGKECWWSAPNTAGPFPMSFLSFSFCSSKHQENTGGQYARWREGGRKGETERDWKRVVSKDEAGDRESCLIPSGSLGAHYGPFQGSAQWDPAWAPQSHSFNIPYTSRCCMPPFTCFLVLLWLSILLRPIPACGWEFRFQTGCWRCPKSVPEPPQDSNYLYSVFF